MPALPAYLLRHSVTVEAYQGQSSLGPVYAAGVALSCFVEYRRRLVRTTDARQVTSTATAYAAPGATVPAESRVTLPDGTHATVLAVIPRDGGGLPTPDHLEIQLG